jgi:uncharacterized protein with HEPN domain
MTTSCISVTCSTWREGVAIAAGKSLADLREDYVLQYALVHVLQVIGEAARRVSPAQQAELAEIPWKQIIGMRHRLVHNYTDITFRLVLDAISDDLGPLIDALNRVLPAEPE